MLADRLLDIPRFRCVVRVGGETKNGIVFEPLARSDVRLEEHIVHVDGGNNFGARDIAVLINDAYLSKWDTSMPLWRMKIITNTKDGRSLLFVAIDHAIGDGVGLMSVFLSLFDDANTPGEASVDEIKTQKEKRKPQGLSISHRAVAFLKGIRAGTVDVLLPPPSDPMNMLMIPKVRLNDPCPGKSFAQTRAFLLSEVKKMKNKFLGATVNDVIMALLAMAIKQFLESKGDTEALDLVREGRGSIPARFAVDMRSGGDSGDGADLGNNIVNGCFPFPVDYDDPIDCIWRIKTLVDEMKVSPAFALQKWMLGAILPIAPDTMLAKDWLYNMNRETCAISNVMGPTGAASLGGCAIEDLAFTAAFASGLYIGVLSFGGNLRVSGILDRRIEGDVAELMKCYGGSYNDLGAALEDVDENEPLEKPDMRPLSAKILELLFYAFIILPPVFLAYKLVS